MTPCDSSDCTCATSRKAMLQGGNHSGGGEVPNREDLGQVFENAGFTLL